MFLNHLHFWKYTIHVLPCTMVSSMIVFICKYNDITVGYQPSILSSDSANMLMDMYPCVVVWMPCLNDHKWWCTLLFICALHCCHCIIVNLGSKRHMSAPAWSSRGVKLFVGHILTFCNILFGNELLSHSISRVDIWAHIGHQLSMSIGIIHWEKMLSPADWCHTGMQTASNSWHQKNGGSALYPLSTYYCIHTNSCNMTYNMYNWLCYSYGLLMNNITTQMKTSTDVRAMPLALPMYVIVTNVRYYHKEYTSSWGIMLWHRHTFPIVI